MKKSQEIIGLPVFSIMDGKKIGQVKDLVINPEEGKVDFIMVSNRNWYVGARVLAYKSVMGIGEHAVTTESENSLTSINETANANNLLERNIELKGNRVLTNKGNLIGVISEYEINEDTGKISRLEYRTAEDESKIEVIEAEQVMTYGIDVLVIRQNGGGSPGPAPTPDEPVITHAAPVQQEIISTNSVPEPVMPSLETAPVPPAESLTPPTPVAPVQAVPVQTAPAQAAPAPAPEPVAPAPQATDGAAFFRQRQRQFLLGKKLIQDIRDAAGNILFAQGTVVTEEVLNLAEQNNKFVELTQCAR